MGFPILVRCHLYIESGPRWSFTYISQRPRDTVITLSLRQNYVAMSFWRNDYVIVVSCIRPAVPSAVCSSETFSISFISTKASRKACLICSNEVTTVAVGGLASLQARAFAGTVMTEFGRRTGIGSTTPWAHDAIITLLLHQNDVATSFWRNTNVIITSCQLGN